MAPAANHGDTWLVEPVTGTVRQITNGLEAVTLEAAGYKAFATEAEAKSYAGAVAAGLQQFGGLGGEISSADQNASSLASDTGSVTGFLGRLEDSNTWIRVAEFTVGAMLIYLGIRALFPSQVSAVTGPVKKVAKAGMFA